MLSMFKIDLQTPWTGLRFLLGIRALVLGAQASVEVELQFPQAEIHVIGDPIPLVWRFTNRSPEPLAFMWEGCCRLNGKLTVTKEGKVLGPIPPGQALAHMFAKAERLNSGVGRDFDTFLSDWVVLKESGAYSLQGRYVGVLPTQKPQVPRGLGLWRGEATTPVIGLNVLSAEDYLNQRNARAASRQIRLELAGSNALPPLGKTLLQLEISNLATSRQKLTWPNQFQVWILDHEGQRLRNVASSIVGAYEEMTLQPRASTTREVPLSSEWWEGQSFGDYRIFIDLASAGPQELRVPSNPIAVRWNLSTNDVVELVSAAAAGPKTGLRNAPLKLLRVYLTEIRSALDSIDVDRISPSVAALARQLKLAACLKPLAPRPGQVNWDVIVGSSGSIRFAEATLTECAVSVSGSIPERLPELLEVRRHLGWEVGVVLKPEAQTSIRQIAGAAIQFEKYGKDLASRPRATTSIGGTGSPGFVYFSEAMVPANLVLRLRRSSDGLVCGVARRFPAPDQGQGTTHFTPSEIARLEFAPLNSVSELEGLLRTGQLRSPQTVAWIDPDLKWAEIEVVLEPLLKRAFDVEVVAAK